MARIAKIKKANEVGRLYEKYLSPGDIASLERLENTLHDETFSVAVIGLYNHGKSTLLNVLVEDFSLQTFKTADVRETVENKCIVKNGIQYIDTPGLNANEHDDKRALDVVEEVDIVLFVHNANAGELREKEVEFLHLIRQYWEDPVAFLERTVFVLTRADEAVETENLLRVKERIAHQLQEIFALHESKSLQIMEVSAKDYLDGKNEEEEELVEQSNIVMLKKQIDALIDKHKAAILQTKQARLGRQYDEIIKSLTHKHQEISMKLSDLTMEETENLINAQEEVSEVEEVLSSKYKEMERI